jgi:hypothetical protein
MSLNDTSYLSSELEGCTSHERPKVITEVWEAGNTSPQEHSIITSWLSAGTIRVFGALGSQALPLCPDWTISPLVDYGVAYPEGGRPSRLEGKGSGRGWALGPRANSGGALDLSPTDYTSM